MGITVKWKLLFRVQGLRISRAYQALPKIRVTVRVLLFLDARSYPAR